MKILFLSAEVEPFAKVGGLADVAGSLPRALSDLGHEVRVVMPAYGMVAYNALWGAERAVSAFPVNLNSAETILGTLYTIEHDGLSVWLIGGDHFFNHVSMSTEVYSPGRDAYLFFAQAALEACEQLDWRPDVVHANDWHTGFAPVFLNEKMDWPETASVFTIHNLAYQGEFGPDTVVAAGLPVALYNWQQLETWGGVNFLKSGCAYADQVNTVSPAYAKEIQTVEYGCRLHGLMSFLAEQGRLSGILNGIDVELHDPATDARIPFNFDVSDRSGKAKCREQLGQELGLVLDARTPVVSVVSRLSNQKGFDLILAELEPILNLGVALVILAVGDPVMADEFRELSLRHPGRFSFIEAYDADLAQRVYAGSDVFLMPSSYEPCGLGQMFALRYGTVPVVRKTGGLGDTVFEGVNGFLFEERSSEHMLAAVERAVEAFRKPEAWDRLVRTAMEGDYSWAKSAKEYVAMYEKAVAARRPKLRKSSAGG